MRISDAHLTWAFRLAPIATCMVAVLLLLSGCVFKQVKEQQKKIAALSRLYGTVRAEHASASPIVVVLIRMNGDAKEIVDHFVLEKAGRWLFIVTPGTYGLAAFEDKNADLVYQPNEPALNIEKDNTFTLATGDVQRNINLVIPSKGRARVDGEVDIRALQTRTIVDQMDATLGELLIVGKVMPLSDPRFDPKNGKIGMWRPYDFTFDVGPGVYFLSAYDPNKIPVLFVHGITGTPRNFTYLINNLDHERFQPWVYYYPSGASLQRLGEVLSSNLIIPLQIQYRFKKLFVVAHSMGGLVSRAFILQHYSDTHKHYIPLFVSISTPWGGVTSAHQGVKHAPAVVRSWYDIAPNSDFLNDIFWMNPHKKTIRRQLPGYLSYLLLFGFKRHYQSPGVSDDTVVTVASELAWEAQQDATRIYGFDDTHTGILQNPAVAVLLNKLFIEASQ